MPGSRRSEPPHAPTGGERLVGAVTEIDGVVVLPVLHERLEFADCVRRLMREVRFDAVAVEIPSSLERAWLGAVDRLPQVSGLLYENAAGRTIFLAVQPADPLVEAARAAREAGLPVRCADLDVDGYADYRDPLPDPYCVKRLGLAAVCRSFDAVPRRRDPEDGRREAAMAYHARELRAQGARHVLLVCGMHHARSVADELGREQAIPHTTPARRDLRTVHLHPDSLSEVLAEIPFYVAVYERHRAGCPAPRPPHAGGAPAVRRGPFRVISGEGRERADRVAEAIDDATRAAYDEPDGAPRTLDRLDLQLRLLALAERQLVDCVHDEEVKPWQRLNLARYARNLALANGGLVPDLFDLVVAARGSVSDNYAWELYHAASVYPAQATSIADLATVRIRADEVFDGTRRTRIRRMVRRPKRPAWRSVLRGKRKTERWPGEWIEGFDGEAICSYPPEDVVIENFGRYLRRRGKQVLSDERARSVPFTSSVLDGIDVRETIRRWSEGTIFVREAGRVPGEVGSVVMVFDEDDDAYPYRQTWIGEHEQESDMAFYSTEPAQGIVGPGICRVTYGGFMMSYPPQRMLDVWADRDYRIAESSAEILLLAAMDYTEQRYVVHVGPRPPRSMLQQLAARLGLKILHLPLGTLSPPTIRRIRVMHVLSGHDKREIARDYTW